MPLWGRNLWDFFQALSLSGDAYFKKIFDQAESSNFGCFKLGMFFSVNDYCKLS